MPSLEHQISEQALPDANPHAWLVRRIDDLHAAAEARSKPVASLRDAVRSFERRLAGFGDMATTANRELGEELIRTAAGMDDSDERLPEYVHQMRRLEVRIDFSVGTRRLVKDFFQAYGPRELVAALRDGILHPRYLAEALSLQDSDIRERRQPASPNDALRGGIPESLRFGFDALSSDLVPKSVGKQATAIAGQMTNRAYGRAAASLQELLRSWPDAPEEARELPAALLKREHDERRREERLFSLQGELYDVMRLAHPERHDTIERRQKTEEIFRLGNLVGDVVPLLPKEDHSGAPFKVTLEYKGETRVAVVKFAFAERFARDGVTPGNGHWREVAGAMHALAFGLDAPAVVARSTEGFGEVTLMELLDGKSCNLEGNWFLGTDGNFRQELGTMALEEYLKFRTDGAPRNNLRTADGRIVPIDHGSDMPSDPDVAMSSVALYLMSDSGETVSKGLQDRVRAWAASAERRIFQEMVGLFPEDMGAYLGAYDARLRDLIATFDQAADPLFPRYRPIDHKDFGARFMDDYEDLQIAWRQPRVTVPDVTAPRIRNV